MPVFQEAIADKCKVPYHFAPAHMNRQRAASLCARAEAYYLAGKSADGSRAQTGISASVTGGKRTHGSAKERSGIMDIRIRPFAGWKISTGSQRWKRRIFSEPWTKTGFFGDAFRDRTCLFSGRRSRKTCVPMASYIATVMKGEIPTIAVSEEARGRGLGKEAFIPDDGGSGEKGA